MGGVSEAIYILSNARLEAELRRANYTVIGYGKQDGEIFIAIKFPEGRSIADVCRKIHSLKENPRARRIIAEFNGVNAFLPQTFFRGSPLPWEIDLDKLMIPLVVLDPPLRYKRRWVDVAVRRGAP